MSAGTLFFWARAVKARSRAATAESRRVLTANETGAPAGTAGGAATALGAAGGGLEGALDGRFFAHWPGPQSESEPKAARGPCTPSRHVISSYVIRSYTRRAV